MIWFGSILTSISYFIFNWQFFCCAASVLEMDPPRKRSLIETYVLNYAVFILCSVLALHLIINWMIVLFLLLVELKLLYRRPLMECFLMALMGTQIGLAVNILLRSLFAILWSVPLIVFDNNTMMEGNRKVYPIFFGFLIGGFIFWIVKRWRILEKLKLVLRDRTNLAFLICVLIAMQMYLCLNLLVYYITDNSLVLKLWSMKSSLFVFVGEGLAAILAIQTGQISVYREENLLSRHLLAEQQIREKELWEVASTDPLTGCYNRLQAEKHMKEVLDSQYPFVICFVDLNGLKQVNDSLGHKMGDQYLLAVVEALAQACDGSGSLFRYGGDEFLLILLNTTVMEAASCLRKSQQWLREESKKRNYPFCMSVSYGFSTRSDGENIATLLQIADERMYLMKFAGKSESDSGETG